MKPKAIACVLNKLVEYCWQVGNRARQDNVERSVSLIYHINVFPKWANTAVYTADDGLNPYSVCRNDIGISQAAMAFVNCVQDYLDMSFVSW